MVPERSDCQKMLPKGCFPLHSFRKIVSKKDGNEKDKWLPKDGFQRGSQKEKSKKVVRERSFTKG